MTDLIEILIFIFLVFFFGVLLRFSLLNRHLIMIISLCVPFVLSLIGLFEAINLRMIDSITLLQVDATIIAGAIILLTVNSFVANKPHFAIPTNLILNRVIPWTPQQVASTTIALFGLSAFFVILENVFPSALGGAMIMALVGFGYLIITGIVLATKEKFSNTPDGESV